MMDFLKTSHQLQQIPFKMLLVTISGLAQVGQIVSAIVTDANGTTNEPISYQWIVDGTDITGATASNYTLSDTHIGETISVMASYTDDDGFSEAITSAPTAPVIAASVITSGGNFARGTLGDKDSVPEINCDVVYTSTSSLESNTSRNMTAGTTLCLADGNYSGLEIDFGGAGTEAAPITIAAENPGGAIIDSGEAAIRMSGSYAVLQGLVFKDVELASSDFLQTRNGSGGDHCNNCRITEVSLIDLQSDNSGIWINIYGQNNRVDHSWITGKVNANPMLIINREIADGQSASDVLPNFTEIDHNYFGDRPPINGKAYAENSDNGYEAIRLGTSPAQSSWAMVIRSLAAFVLSMTVIVS